MRPRDALAAALLALAAAAATPARADEPAPVPPTEGDRTPPRLATSALDKKPPARRVGFREAVRAAMDRNPQLKIAELEVRRAEALVEQARAASLPRATVGATYTRLDSDRKLGDRVLQQEDALGANLTVTPPLVAAASWAGWYRATGNVRTFEAASADVRRTLGITTARAWLAVVAQKRTLEAQERAIAAARAHADFARSRFQGGVGNRLDLVRAEQDLAQSEAQASTILAALAQSREALGVLLGESDAIDATDEAPPELGGPPRTATRKELLEKRQDLRSLETRVDVAERSSKYGYTDFIPTLSALATPFYANPATPTTPTTGWSAQLVLAWPLYEGGLRYGQQHEREVVLAEAKTALDAGVRQAESDGRAATAAVKHADDALAASRRASELAAETLALATTAYRAGASTNIEVLDAERRARDAEALVVVAEDVARRARLDALAAAGVFP